MARFEGPDPAYWCKQGYAVVNADSRGAGHSEGNLVVWGEQDGRDGADVIEWIASQVWSNGKVGMFGNSGLAMCQWWIAAEQPPGLACIAPWEGTRRPLPRVRDRERHPLPRVSSTSSWAARAARPTSRTSSRWSRSTR